LHIKMQMKLTSTITPPQVLLPSSFAPFSATIMAKTLKDIVTCLCTLY